MQRRIYPVVGLALLVLLPLSLAVGCGRTEEPTSAAATAPPASSTSSTPPPAPGTACSDETERPFCTISRRLGISRKVL
jgi:hypothetical protein